MSYENLFKEIDTEFKRFTGSGAWFDGFDVLKNPTLRRPLDPPFIVMEKVPGPTGRK